MSANPAHRHLVVAPLFALMMLSSVARGLPAASQDFAQGSEAWVPMLPVSGDVFFAQAEGAVQSHPPAITDGAALFAGQGRMDVLAEGATVTALGGAFHLSARGGSLTVAALTAPVLIAMEGHVLLVPVGHQWRGNAATLQGLDAGMDAWLDARVLQPLPEQFLRDRIAAVRSLPLSDPLPAARLTRPSGPFLASLLLPAAFARRQSEEQEALLGYLRGLTESDRETDAQTLLARGQMQAALDTPRGRTVLTRLLLGLPSDSALIQPFLLALQDDAAVPVLASMHSSLRADAWTMTDTGLSEEQQVARYIALPHAGTVVDEPLSVFTLRRFAQGLAARPDASALLAVIVPRAAAVVDDHANLGFPERAERLREAILAAAAPHRAALPPHAQQELSRLERMNRVDIALASQPLPDVQIVPAPVSVEDREEMPETPENAAELEAQATVLLQEAGALFTLETVVRAVAPDTVHIGGILFGSAAGDRMFSFNLTLSSKTVAEITLEGKTYPNTMSFLKFAEWATGE